jgi:hypothetical protein
MTLQGMCVQMCLSLQSVTEVSVFVGTPPRSPLPLLPVHQDGDNHVWLSLAYQTYIRTVPHMQVGGARWQQQQRTVHGCPRNVHAPYGFLAPWPGLVSDAQSGSNAKIFDDFAHKHDQDAMCCTRE